MLSSINTVVGLGYRTTGISTVPIWKVPTFAVYIVVDYNIFMKLDNYLGTSSFSKC
jgi:hypothetical protein